MRKSHGNKVLVNYLIKPMFHESVYSLAQTFLDSQPMRIICRYGSKDISTMSGVGGIKEIETM